jgi:hypothetical protein
MWITQDELPTFLLMTTITKIIHVHLNHQKRSTSGRHGQACNLQPATCNLQLTPCNLTEFERRFL